MSKKAKPEPKAPKPMGKARAAAIHAEIDKLTGNKTGAAANEPAAPSSPRDFIQRWMAEHDKEPGKK